MAKSSKTLPPMTAALFLLLTVALAVLVTRQFVAYRLATRGDLAGLQAAVRWAPGNAEYHYLLGRYFALLTADIPAALEQYQAAVRLNPHDAHYWFELANTYGMTGDDSAQLAAIEGAIPVDPTTPDVAWEAANLYLVRGDKDKALREFAVALQNQPVLSAAELQLCWRAFPDVTTMLQRVLPPRPDAYLTFLDMLIARRETAGAAQVWSALIGLHQPFETRYLFGYIHYLVVEREVDQARHVWQQATALLGLTAYMPSADNLIVNPNFSLDVLNGGFDWIYEKQPGVLLSLDSSQFHSGNRSLLIDFDSTAINDADVFQLVPVSANSHYALTAYVRSSEFAGAGGIRLTLQDFYSGQVYFQSQDMVNAEYWKSVTGSFTTAPGASLLVVRFPRVPAGIPIRGKLWLGDLQLTAGAAPSNP